VIDVLRMLRVANKEKAIVVILDNFPSHKAKDVLKEAEKLNIHLVFLPPYSPDLNPIEFLWKIFIESIQDLKSFIKEKAENLCNNRGYAKGWLRKFSALFQKIFNTKFCNFLSEGLYIAKIVSINFIYYILHI